MNLCKRHRDICKPLQGTGQYDKSWAENRIHAAPCSGGNDRSGHSQVCYSITCLSRIGTVFAINPRRPTMGIMSSREPLLVKK